MLIFGCIPKMDKKQNSGTKGLMLKGLSKLTFKTITSLKDRVK